MIACSVPVTLRWRTVTFHAFGFGRCPSGRSGRPSRGRPAVHGESVEEDVVDATERLREVDGVVAVDADGRCRR